MGPEISTRVESRLSDFIPVTAQEIAELLRKAPTKHCDQDPVPTWLVKNASAVFPPLLSGMCNASLSAGVLSISQKHSAVRPLLKKPTLDPDVLSSYRPISNLTFTLKLVDDSTRRKQQSPPYTTTSCVLPTPIVSLHSFCSI